MKASLSRSALLFTVSIFSHPLHAAGLGIDLTVDLATTEGTPESAVSGALTTLCPQLQAMSNRNAEQERLLALCTLINNAEAPEAALTAVSARSASSETTVATRLRAGGDIAAIGKRLAALRRSASQLARAETNTPRGGNAGDEEDTGRLSGFVTANLGAYEKTETLTEAGFEGDSFGLTAGADYRFSPALFAGLAGNFSNNEADLVRNTGTLEASDYGLTLYGTYYPSETWYLEASLGYGLQSYDLSREIDFTLNGQTTDETAKSSPDGSRLGLSVGGGWEQAWAGGTALTLQGTFNYASTTIDGFTESNAEGLNLIVEEQSIDSLRLLLGAQLQHPFSTAIGVLAPQLSAALIHEFEQDGQDITARFAADPNANSFSYTTAERDTDYMSVAVGVSLLGAGGVAGFLQYETLLMVDDYEQSLISIGGRMEF